MASVRKIQQNNHSIWNVDIESMSNIKFHLCPKHWLNSIPFMFSTIVLNDDYLHSDRIILMVEQFTVAHYYNFNVDRQWEWHDQFNLSGLYWGYKPYTSDTCELWDGGGGEGHEIEWIYPSFKCANCHVLPLSNCSILLLRLFIDLFGPPSPHAWQGP